MSETATISPTITDIANGTTASFSFIAKPVDSRCSYWAKVFGIQDAPMPGGVNGADGLPGDYLRKGADVEVFDWEAIAEGEANHHRKMRGWTFTFRIVLDGEPTIIPLSAATKDSIKTCGATKDILSGSGDHAAMARICAWLASTDDEVERRWRLAMICPDFDRIAKIISPAYREALSQRFNRLFVSYGYWRTYDEHLTLVARVVSPSSISDDLRTEIAGRIAVLAGKQQDENRRQELIGHAARIAVDGKVPQVPQVAAVVPTPAPETAPVAAA